MDPLTLFRTIVFVGALTCTLFGLLFLVSPDSVRRLSQVANHSILTLDTVIGKRPRLSGSVLLLLGATVCLILVAF
ncbi:MAG: hypothetical protein ACE5HK_00200 [Candidatus Methylomirabilales bacterium]